jgi:hypothetical protein
VFEVVSKFHSSDAKQEDHQQQQTKQQKTETTQHPMSTRNRKHRSQQLSDNCVLPS